MSVSCDTVRHRINMVSYQVVRPVEVQMVIFIILVLDHNIVLPECGQDPFLPPRHLWRWLCRGGRGQSLRSVEGDLELLLVIDRGATVEMVIRLGKELARKSNINIQQDKELVGSDSMTLNLLLAECSLSALWVRKMKIYCSCQTCAAQTDRHLHSLSFYWSQKIIFISFTIRMLFFLRRSGILSILFFFEDKGNSNSLPLWKESLETARLWGWGSLGSLGGCQDCLNTITASRGLRL